MHEVLVIGGGPAGLTAAMFCRMRKMSVLVLDAGRLGGQLVSLYGDKPVHDWPGYAHIIAGDLAQHLIDHAREIGVEMTGNRKVLDMKPLEGGGFELATHDPTTSTDHAYSAQTVIVAIGGGAFEPRKLKVAGEETLDESALTYRLVDKARVPGKRVVVIGGGDSGLESAQTAHQAGAKVTLVQALDRFTGMETNIDQVNQMEIPRHFNSRVKALEVEDGVLRAVIIQTKGAPEPVGLECDYLVVNIGAAVNLDAIKRWGIATEGNQITVNPHMHTSLEGVFACGDIATFDGKYKLLLTASGEGCVAAQSAYVYVRKPQRVTMGELYT
ncbi:MAG: NAD(P)/FAD-dependent oxidoreductase [Candidatus Eisenbacteria bacterium]|uniref:Ferredoxin--NADP reductase n=1 Tax=Eiseniibacteriota bacterium TaxID=2212470 RepID=A0A849SJN8_UNCEI|nr:NAD(P)/FAD-dependent oxidoreductase [Candidatus Eisenbacteria bacterium]